MKISAIFIALAVLSIVVAGAQAQQAQQQAQELIEGSITQQRKLIAEGAFILSMIGLGSLASIPLLGSVISAVVGLLAIVGMSALGMLAIPTTTIGIIIALIIGTIVVALGPIGLVIVLAVLALSGGGFSVSVLLSILGVGGVLLVALAGPIISVAGVIITALAGLPVIGTVITTLLGGAGAVAGGVAGGFSLLAGGAGAITGITFFFLNSFLAFCANFPVLFQFVSLCCYPFIAILSTILPLIDALCGPLFIVLGELCGPLCAGLLGGALA